MGGGPAGLMAANKLSQAGVQVHLFDAMPSVGRKFLLAGRGGLNLTHSEPLAQFQQRFGASEPWVTPWLAQWGPDQVRQWALSLGVATFVGTSGRVFPVDFKAAPLLRNWLQHLRHAPVPVQFHMRHRWTGWGASGNTLVFETPAGTTEFFADAVVLALGGASWPRLGSNGAWVELLGQHGVPISPLQSANCGFDLAQPWSPLFANKFAGQPFKSVALRVAHGAQVLERKGEFVATATGVEGSLIYAASALLRQQINATGQATLELDLLPDFSAQKVLQEVGTPRGSKSTSNHLKSRLGLQGIKHALLLELLTKAQYQDTALLAQAIKALPITLARTRPLAEAISTAGGVQASGLNPGLMLKNWPGVFCAGEMLDWDAPTGGYLLTACLASGVQAAQSVQAFLAEHGQFGIS